MTIKKDLFKAIRLSTASKYLVYSIQLVTISIYSRIFTPENFGVFAMLQVFLMFFILLADIGIGPAIINLKKVTKDKNNAIFTVTIIISIAVILLYIISLPLIVSFYSNENLYNYTIYIVIVIFFSTISIVSKANINKNKKFFVLGSVDAISEIITLIIVIIFFYFKLLDGVSLLFLRFSILSILKWLGYTIMSYKILGYTVKITSNLKESFDIFKFSINQFAFNLTNYFSRNLDTILVGKYFSSESLGIYDRTYALMRYPLQLISFAVTPAIQPVMVNYQSDKNKLNYIRKVLFRNASKIGVVIGILMYYFSNYYVTILLGSNWNSVIPIITILSISIPIQIIQSFYGAILQGMGLSKELLIYGIYSTFINVTFIVVGIMLGDLKALSWMIICGFYINYVISQYYMHASIFNEGVKSFIYENRYVVIFLFIVLMSKMGVV